MVLPGGFPRQFDLKIYSLAVPNTMSENIALAMLTDMNDGTVFRVELTHRVVSCYTAVLAEGCYDLVLEYIF